jgi:hypothetical protein
LSGTYALLTYASMIFNLAGSSMSPNSSAIIVGAIQVIGVGVSTLLVDRAGRKFLMVNVFHKFHLLYKFFVDRFHRPFVAPWV